MSENMVIFTRTFDLLTWLLPRCDSFPKSQRFVVTKRVQDAALDFQEALFHANAQRDVERIHFLKTADARLSCLRLYLRLTYQWSWLDDGQYAHVSHIIEEIGRLLGGWLKQSGRV
jgi:hypothetical protein